MGGCIPDAQNTVNKRRVHKITHNPIQDIIDRHSIQKLRQKWSNHQLETMQHKMLGLQKQNLNFKEFANLFPKIMQFSERTQRNIYNLFSYNGDDYLSKKELVDALTLIRKVTKNSDFALFLFYIYKKNPQKAHLTEQQFKLFKTQNEKYLKRLPLTNTNEIEPESLEEQDIQDSKQPPSRRQIDNSINTGNELSVRNGNQSIRNTGNTEPRRSKEKNGYNRIVPQYIEEKVINQMEFKQQFQKYNLAAYQVMFSWDLKQEQKELIKEIKANRIEIIPQNKVYVTDYAWWLEWVQYIELSYNIKIQFSERHAQNYQSTRNNRRESFSKNVQTGTKMQPKSPGQIKNGRLLKQGKIRNELLPNLVEFDNYICLPQKIWNKLVAIYHGGPPIERIYPKIYNSIIIKATLSDQCKFFYKLRRFSKGNNFKISDISTQKQRTYRPYYKYSGRNWTKLPQSAEQQQQIFNSLRTYIVFVPPRIQKDFLNYYNIQETSHGKILRRRFKNFGSQINISIKGVLTKAEVTEIIKPDIIRVAYLDQNGIPHNINVQIDQKLRKLNPENIDSQKKLNQLPGLRNIGNTCYINAVLQCLMRTPYFGSYLQRQDFHEDEDELLLEQLARLQKDSRSYHTLDIINTKRFKKVLDQYCPMFQGNFQHDSQEFLLVLLSRLSQQIKSKQEFGDLRKTKNVGDVNKKIVKFFSGKTQAITECLKCHNQSKRIQPFYTYSVSLPEMKESQYYYYMVGHPDVAKRMIPMRYGITLDRKINVEAFIKQVANVQNKDAERLVLYLIDNNNNQIQDRLSPNSWQQVDHFLNFNAKLVFYEIQHILEPTYSSYQNKQLQNRSVKLQLSQRIYNQKANDYKLIYMPFVLEITYKMKWSHLIQRVNLIIDKMIQEQQDQEELDDLHVSDNRVKMLSNSGIKVQVGESPVRKSSKKVNQKVKRNYKIRVVKNNHSYDHHCFFCKNQFGERRSRTRKCKEQGCKFLTDRPLFQDQNFKNYHDKIWIVVDWYNHQPQNIPNSIDHSSYQLSIKRSQQRKDMLEQLLVNSYKEVEILELNCQKQSCKYNQAQRSQRIQTLPNILLLHLKRFRYENDRLVKLTNRVVYPHQFKMPGSQELYLLYGVVVHYGSGVGGHYVSYVRVNGKWYYCDDSRVTLADPQAEIDTNAYILFYHKASFETSLICLGF